MIQDRLPMLESVEAVTLLHMDKIMKSVDRRSWAGDTGEGSGCMS
jgi:hypothetical protein